MALAQDRDSWRRHTTEFIEFSCGSKKVYSRREFLECNDFYAFEGKWRGSGPQPPGQLLATGRMLVRIGRIPSPGQVFARDVSVNVQVLPGTFRSYPSPREAPRDAPECLNFDVVDPFARAAALWGLSTCFVSWNSSSMRRGSSSGCSQNHSRQLESTPGAPRSS